MSCQKENHPACNCTTTATTCAQSLDDMEFERGIWSAAQEGDEHRVKKLAATQGVDKLDGAGYTALHHAARCGHVETCRLLLDLGAAIDARTRSGRATPLHRAAGAGKEKVVAMLLAAGADPHLKDSDGQTALHRSVANGHLHLARSISAAHPKLKFERDNRGRSPLDLARLSQKNDFESFDFLE